MINQPSNLQLKNKNGTVTFRWSPDFASDWQEQYDQSQSILTKDVLEFSEPYIPKKSGRLIRSGKADEEEGTVSWTTPYAKFRYYMPEKTARVGLRGSFWFERMKKSRLHTLVQDSKKAFK